MADKNRSDALPSEGSTVGAASASIGAVIVATLGAACCSVPFLGPLIVAALGASGAATFAGIKPYTPYLFILSFLMLAFSFWAVYRPSKQCVVDSHSQVRYAARQSIMILLWVATTIWVISVGLTLISLAKS